MKTSLRFVELIVLLHCAIETKVTPDFVNVSLTLVVAADLLFGVLGAFLPTVEFVPLRHCVETQGTGEHGTLQSDCYV